MIYGGRRQQSSTSYPTLFYMVDSTDHIAGKTGLSPTVTISKNGAASFNSPSGGISEVGNGWYALAGNATDRATLGPLALHATATGADPCDIQFEIIAANPFAAECDLSAAAVDAILDEVVEGSMTMRQLLRVFLSVLANKSSGGAGNNPAFRDLADGKNRIAATVDADGNRTAVTLDAS